MTKRMVVAGIWTCSGNVSLKCAAQLMPPNEPECYNPLSKACESHRRSEHSQRSGPVDRKEYQVGYDDSQPTETIANQIEHTQTNELGCAHQPVCGMSCYDWVRSAISMTAEVAKPFKTGFEY